MGFFDGKKDKILTGAIITVALAGVLIFGYRAIRGNYAKDQKNPFEYDIKRFQTSDADLENYTESSRIRIDLPKISGIAIGPDDIIYVSRKNSVLVFDPDGTLRSSFPTDGAARCLAVDKNHDLYLGMEDHVEIFDRGGKKKAEWQSLGQKAIVTSLALSEKNVFVADAGNQTVWKFDKTGSKIIRIGDKDESKDIPGFIIPSPYFDVAVDPDGFLWVADTGRHSLENYTLDGDFRSSWGEFGMEIEKFCGCCNPTHFVILEDGSFVTSEKGLARVKVYNRIGNLVSIAASTDDFYEGTIGLDLAVDSTQKIYVLDPQQNLVRVFAKKKP
jgi:sugar lactone lactonase YvrE